MNQWFQTVFFTFKSRMFIFHCPDCVAPGKVHVIVTYLIDPTLKMCKPMWLEGSVWVCEWKMVGWGIEWVSGADYQKGGYLCNTIEQLRSVFLHPLCYFMWLLSRLGMGRWEGCGVGDHVEGEFRRSSSVALTFKRGKRDPLGRHLTCPRFTRCKKSFEKLWILTEICSKNNFWTIRTHIFISK